MDRASFIYIYKGNWVHFSLLGAQGPGGPGAPVDFRVARSGIPSLSSRWEKASPRAAERGRKGGIGDFSARKVGLVILALER